MNSMVRVQPGWVRSVAWFGREHSKVWYTALAMLTVVDVFGGCAASPQKHSFTDQSPCGFKISHKSGRCIRITTSLVFLPDGEPRGP